MSSRVSKLSPMFLLMAGTTGEWEAERSRLAHLPLRALQMIRGSLRAKFIIIIILLQMTVMGAVTIVMERHQRSAILEQTRLRARSLAGSLAALSEEYLVSYNYRRLEQAAEDVTADNEDVIYAVAHLHDGKVGAFSGRDDLQGQRIDDPVSRRALQATEPLVQSIVSPESRELGYDVAIPVYIRGSSKKWGTIRLGFSLKRAHSLIYQTWRDLLLLSLGAIICGTSLAIFLAMRISNPIGQLVGGVHAFAKGAYDRPIQVDTHDEIGYLARAFEQMRTSLHLHLAKLADEKRRLEEANRRLQETQEQLIQAERLAAVGKLAARVAHEVNNPLAIMKTAIGIIRDENGEEDLSKRSLQEIEEEISRIARIIRALLDFSRPSPTADAVQMNAVIQSLEPLLTQSLQAKHIALSVILEPGLAQVRISSDHLKQVLLNMVRNAEDAMPEGGELVIQTAWMGESVELRVADTGLGIPEEDIPHLFDPFFTTKATGEGVGLGLSVIYGIIKNANGRIEVESKVGTGTTFLVTLPAYEA